MRCLTLTLTASRQDVPFQFLPNRNMAVMRCSAMLDVVIPPLALLQQPLSRRLGDELVVLGMSADPDPVDVAYFVNAQCSIMVTNAD
jgi:hypothetical protein